MVALAAERGARVAAALRERPADEPLEHAVVGALLDQYSDEGEPDRDALALITSAPALQAEFLDTIAAIERPLAEAIMARTDTDRHTGLGPEVLAAAVSAAARVAAQRWLQPEPVTTFSVMLQDALTWIAPPCARPTADVRRQGAAYGGRGRLGDRRSGCRAGSGLRAPSSRTARPPAGGCASAPSRSA